jgi:hypothetical protein
MFDPIQNDSRALFAARVLLTVCVLEFFGPWLRDFSASHAFNPTWVGHARVHLMWQLGFMLFSGIANLYLIWWVRPMRMAALYVSAAWLASNLLGFWLAIAMVPIYDGVIAPPDTHVFIYGIEENILVFSLLSVCLLAAIGLLRLHAADIPQTRAVEA